MANLLNTSNLAAAVAPLVDIHETSVSDTRRKRTIGECCCETEINSTLIILQFGKIHNVVGQQKAEELSLDEVNAAEFSVCKSTYFWIIRGQFKGKY